MQILFWLLGAGRLLTSGEFWGGLFKFLKSPLGIVVLFGVFFGAGYITGHHKMAQTCATRVEQLDKEWNAKVDAANQKFFALKEQRKQEIDAIVKQQTDADNEKMTQREKDWQQKFDAWLKDRKPRCVVKPEDFK